MVAEAEQEVAGGLANAAAATSVPENAVADGATAGEVVVPEAEQEAAGALANAASAVAATAVPGNVVADSAAAGEVVESPAEQDEDVAAGLGNAREMVLAGGAFAVAVQAGSPRARAVTTAAAHRARPRTAPGNTTAP